MGISLRGGSPLKWSFKLGVRQGSSSSASSGQGSLERELFKFGMAIWACIGRSRRGPTNWTYDAEYVERSVGSWKSHGSCKTAIACDNVKMVKMASSGTTVSRVIFPQDFMLDECVSLYRRPKTLADEQVPSRKCLRWDFQVESNVSNERPEERRDSKTFTV